MVVNNLIRRLGNAEYFYYQYNKIASTNFAVVLELNKHINPSGLRKAINIVVNKYQSFCTNIVPVNRNRLLFERREEKDYNIKIITGASECFTSIIEKEINTQFHDPSIPLRGIYYTEVETEGKYIIFTFNHTLTDAIGAISISKKIIEMAYKKDFNNTINKQEISLNLEQLIPKSGKGLSFFKTLTKFIIANIKFEKKYRNYPHLKVAKYNFNSRSISIKKIVLNKKYYNSFILNSKDSNFTVHHILSAAQIIAIRKEYKCDGNVPITLSMPISLRNRLQLEIQTDNPGLYISIPRLKIEVCENENILDIASKVKRELSNQISSGQIFINWKLLPRSKFNIDKNNLINIEKQFSKNSPSTMITNVGVIRCIEDTNDSPVKSIHFTVAPPKNALLCSSVSSYDNILKINCCFNTDLISEESIQNIYDSFKYQVMDFAEYKNHITVK